MAGGFLNAFVCWTLADGKMGLFHFWKHNCKIRKNFPFFKLFICFLFVFPVLLNQSVKQAVVSALFTSVLACAAVIDYKTMTIPDFLIVFIAVLTVPSFALGLKPGLPDRLLGAAAGFGAMYALAVLSEKFLRKEGMGGGDIKLAAACGLILGFRLNILALILSSFFALGMAALLKWVKPSAYENRQIPFAPPLAFAAFVCYYFGENIINGYTRLWL